MPNILPCISKQSKLDKMASIYVICVCVFVSQMDLSSGQNDNMIRSRGSNEWRPRTRSTICVPRDCKLPDCYCSGKTGPSHLRNYQIPQMVMLTFDDAVNEQVNDYYDKLFSKPRLNPNGCPISATFYLSHNWTNYDMVRDLYASGHEIASHTVTHRLPQSWWTHASLKDWYREVNGQKKNIINKAGVPKSQIRGMRVPFLELGGDKQFTMMSDTGLQYDASFMTGPYDEGGAWPFTLDYPPNWKYCSNNNCPKASFPGVWELPMNRWIGPDGKPCPMVDACQTQPVDTEDTLGYMWYNFNRFYRGNRAPFGIHLHAVWFKKTESYFKALDTFLDALSEMDDVYLVTSSQVISWMKTPTPVKEINSFLPWRRSCFIKDAGQRTTRKPTTTTKRSTTSTTQTPRPTTRTTTKRTTTMPTTTVTRSSTTSPSKIQQETSQIKPKRPTQQVPHSQDTGNVVQQSRDIWNAPEDKQSVEFNEWKPDQSTMQRGSRRNGAPVYPGPPHRDNFYPPSREDYYGRPEQATSETPDDEVSEAHNQPQPWPRPRSQSNLQPEKPLLSEKIKVEIDLKSEEQFVGDKPERNEPVNSLIEPKNKHPVTKEEKSKIRNAYESAKGEATAADRPHYQSSRNSGNTLHSRFPVIVGMTICVLRVMM